MHYNTIKSQDRAVAEILEREDIRQRDGLELIPSENYVSLAVREAMASTLTNKYAEGYPGKRYYGGQENTDAIERLAQERACALFGGKHANVQPLSGAMANNAVYEAILKSGDTVLGMDLAHGGHLTHGHPATASAKTYRFIAYGMSNPDTGEIDYDALEALARAEKPKLIIMGFSAYARTIDYLRIITIAKEVGAYTMADMAHVAGLIAGGTHANPLAFGCDIMTATTHKTLRGPRGGLIVTNSDDLAKKIDKAIFPGIQGGPHMHAIAAKAVAFHEAAQPAFKTYAQQIIKNARVMADVFDREDIRMIGGGTDNHLILLDVFGSLGVTGAEAEKALDAIGITTNKNIIADDTRTALDPSGIRLGTPAITSRGFKEADCARVAEIIIEVLRDGATEEHWTEILALAHAHPIPLVYL